MKKSGLLLLLVLICVAFLVSCGRKNTEEVNKGELVRLEAVGEIPAAFFLVFRPETFSRYSFLDRRGLGWYNFT